MHVRLSAQCTQTSMRYRRLSWGVMVHSWLRVAARSAPDRCRMCGVQFSCWAIGIDRSLSLVLNQCQDVAYRKFRRSFANDHCCFSQDIPPFHSGGSYAERYVGIRKVGAILSMHDSFPTALHGLEHTGTS